MTQDASLKIKVEANDVKGASDALDRLKRSGAGAERSVGGLSKAFSLLSPQLAASALAMGALTKSISVQREFDKLNAGLITATKSSSEAALAFAELERFARETPYTLDQSVEGFTKLVNLGLTPSQKALESYGNTAAAMGKDLNQMIEAVADAATGEFERLKEFGIKAKSEGDNVSFTFQGVTTTVKKNADEIEQYLMKLGQNEFAGAMANRMATLDGAIANLGVSWDSLFRTISQQGAGDLMADSVRGVTSALDELTAMLASGELAGYASAIYAGWKPVLDYLQGHIEDVFNELTDWINKADEATGGLGDAFIKLPQHITRALEIAVAEVIGFVDKAGIQLQRLNAYLTPENWFSDVDIASYYDNQLKEVSKRTAERYVEIDNEFKKGSDLVDATLRDAKEKRLQYETDLLNNDFDLGKFKTGKDQKDDNKPDKKAEAAAKKFQLLKTQAADYIHQLERDAMTEQQIISDDYAIKLAKLDEYLSKKAITQKEYDAAELAARTAYIDQMAALDTKQADKSIKEAERVAETKKRLDQQLLGAQMQFGSEMLGVIEQNAKEGSAIQKVAFAAQKGMAAAQAIIQAEAASMAALQAPPVGLGPVAGQAMAAQIKGMGYASAAVIAAQGFAGMFDNGGNIPSGQWGIVGEYGPEIVKGPANVTSRKDTAAMARNAMSGGNGGVVINQNIVVQGNGDQALISAMQEAARKGAQDGYNQVRQDFATNGSIRRIAGV